MKWVVPVTLNTGPIGLAAYVLSFIESQVRYKEFLL